VRGTNKRNQAGPAGRMPCPAGRIVRHAVLSGRDDRGRPIAAARLPG
jgi:hypothetical protein